MHPLYKCYLSVYLSEWCLSVYTSSETSVCSDRIIMLQKVMGRFPRTLFCCPLWKFLSPGVVPVYVRYSSTFPELFLSLVSREHFRFYRKPLVLLLLASCLFLLHLTCDHLQPAHMTFLDFLLLKHSTVLSWFSWFLVFHHYVSWQRAQWDCSLQWWRIPYLEMANAVSPSI